MKEKQEKSNVKHFRRYRIGDYARYMGVGTAFLKHYEKFGILTAQYEENGYRYFGFEKSSLIIECMRLGNLGFTVREMEAMLHERSGEDAAGALKEARTALEAKIRRMEAFVEEEKRFEAWYAARRETPEDWRIVESEARWFLPHADGSQFLKDERIGALLPAWLEWLPAVKSSLRFTVPQAPSDRLDYQWGLSVEAAKAEAFGLPVNDVLVRLPPAKVFEYHFAGRGQMEVLKRLAQRTHPLYDVLDSLGLKPAGDGSMDLFMTADRRSAREGFGVFRIPVSC